MNKARDGRYRPHFGSWPKPRRVKKPPSGKRTYRAVAQPRTSFSKGMVWRLAPTPRFKLHCKRPVHTVRNAYISKFQSFAGSVTHLF